MILYNLLKVFVALFGMFLQPVLSEGKGPETMKDRTDAYFDFESFNNEGKLRA